MPGPDPHHPCATPGAGRIATGPRGRRAAALVAAGAVLLLTACSGPSVNAPSTAPVVSASGAPASAAPAASQVPVVRATLAPPQQDVRPARVRIPDRDLDVEVVPVGVTRDGGMALPADPSVAGWYRWSADLDADRGTTVLAAHVDSLRYGVGPFVRIRDLSEGAAVRVAGDDGEVRVYRVTGLERVKKAALPAERIFDRGGPHRLVLVTCGGRFDTVTRTYSDNVVVTARLEARSAG